ncbi:MAG: nuclear transport factor 2 family protein [Bacteroidales bacterium]|nr:nuclear transport factor 2 family protein [Bacteroidales bacterium]NLZ96352.1 nuclear transport factor 2 family protein [Bacteroidales bacterium]
MVSVPIQTLCDIVSKGKAEPASYEITALDVQEDIAIVHIESQFGDAKYYDMFSLVKDENGWKIVSKIYRNR